MNTKIPIYLLESFLLAAEESSFQIAADALGITQSTLSKQMILLEEMLPHKVFTFNGRKKVLTPYGNYLLKTLKPKFSQTQELIEQSAFQFSRPENIQVKIAGRGELLDRLATNIDFSGRISFLLLGNDEALQAIIERKADIAIIHTGIDSSEIIMKPYMHNNFKLVVPKKIVKLKNISVSEFLLRVRSLPCLVYKDKDPIFESVIQSWQLKMEEIKVFRTYPNYTTLSKMINAHLGWSVIPTHIEVNEDSNYVFDLPLTPSSQRKFYLCYRRDIAQAAWLKELLLDIKRLS